MTPIVSPLNAIAVSPTSKVTITPSLNTTGNMNIIFLLCPIPNVRPSPLQPENNEQQFF